MRVLLLHPEDSPRRGPWSAQQWDLIVDLGKSSEFAGKAWMEQTQCPLLRLDSFRRGFQDLKLVREMLSTGRGRLIDEEGIDWWALTSLVVATEAETVLALKRLASEVSRTSDLWATRPVWPINAFASLMSRQPQMFSNNLFGRAAGGAKHYARLLRRFSKAQLKEIFLDKYDSGYEWRARLASRENPLDKSVVLTPSAYENVSRMVAAYARLIPEQTFLVVATRRSATTFQSPPNVRLRHLSAYVKKHSPVRETTVLLQNWEGLRAELCKVQEFAVMSQSGLLDSFPRWFRSGLRVRDAWHEVLDGERVGGVLCGDDSNPYTRLPVLLAAKRNIPTVDFHHGAMDGRYVLKDLPCNLYLAKNEMERDYLLRVCNVPSERVEIGAPASRHRAPLEKDDLHKNSIVLFSEPYESAGARTEEVYRELLPPLCRLARETGRRVIIKLHPFEAASERARMIRGFMRDGDRTISIVDGPLSTELLSDAWCGLTVESTTVLDCLSHGVPCFLCEWLAFSPFEYVRQYARFGIGEVLKTVEEIATIPQRLAAPRAPAEKQRDIWDVAEPDKLRQWLTLRPALGFPRGSALFGNSSVDRVAQSASHD